MSQDAPLFRRIQQAILDVFDRDELATAVYFCLEQRLDTLVAEKALDHQVLELLARLDRPGRTPELLRCLQGERKNSSALAYLAAEAEQRQAQAGAGRPILGSIRMGSGPIPLQKPLRVQHFIGREEELARLLEDLRPEKMVALCGPDGIGKSALAAEALWRLAPNDDPPDYFPDGVVFYAFNDQPQAGLALEAIARAYGIDPLPTPRDAARMALAGKRALLVLDGAEAADDLDAILALTGSCGVLITTRRRSDAPDTCRDLTPLADEHSRELLRAWAGDYAAEREDAAELVRRLGGLPLAIFLTGRYLAQQRQQAAEFVEWLQEAELEALHFGNQPSKSIPLLMQRSLAQVSERARAAFGVAGVLAHAPFDKQDVAVALDVKPTVAGHALGELVDYGLLLRPGEEYEAAHLLAHTYARTQIAPPADAVARLSEEYARFAAEQSSRGPVGFAALDRRRPHFVAVQAAALQAQEWDAVMLLAREVASYLDIRGYSTERILIAQAAAAAASTVGNRPAELAFLNDLGIAHKNLGDVRRAIAIYEQQLPIAHEIGSRDGASAVLANLGAAYYLMGDARGAIDLYQQALAIVREIHDRRAEGAVLGNMGLPYALLGENRRAVELYEQSLAIAREMGDRRQESNALGNLAAVYRFLGEPRRAIEMYEQQLAAVHQVGDRRGEGTALGDLGAAYHALGDGARAVELYEQALAITRAIRDRRGESRLLGYLGQVCVEMGQIGRAVELYEQGLSIARATGDPKEEGATLINLGQVYEHVGDHRRAVEFFEQALAIARAIGNRGGEAAALGSLGVAHKNLGDPRRAVEFYEQALVIDREIGDRHGETDELGNLGVAHAMLTDLPRAAACFEQQLDLARAIGDRRNEGNAASNLGNVYAALGEPDRAKEFYARRLVIAREIGDRRGEAVGSWNLGLIYAQEGDLAQAINHMQIRVAYEQEIGHPDAAAYTRHVDQLRAQLGADD